MKSETDSFIRFFFGCKRRFKHYNESKINHYQLQKGRELAQYAYHNAPFFNRLYQNLDLDDVWNLPIITKQHMMDNLGDYNTAGFTKEDLLAFSSRIEKEENYSERFRGFNVAMSSGTSGNKGIVITSPAEEKYLQAAFFARFAFPFTLRIRWAFMLRITTPAFQVSKFGQRLTHINLLLTLDKIREKLQNFQPNILSAPPSMLKILAKEINESRLVIKPKRVVSYAEVLEPDIKQELEETFKTPIHQIYQGSEGSTGLTCRKGSLHVNEDLVNLQLYNKDGSLTEPGNPCFQSIITDLHKKSQPIIRFKLNDIITISPKRCSCGSSFRVIEQIMGRADDLFWGERQELNELQYIFPDYIRRAIISSSDDIEEYQAIQKSVTKVLVRLLLKDKYNESIITQKIQENIKTVFTKYKCKEPNIEIRFESPVKNPNSNKLIRIQRDFKV